MRASFRVGVSIVFTLVLFVLTFSTVFADTSFSSNVEAINKAAESVLMLEVYDSNDQMIATGSGFIAFDSYTLVTNEHVIENAELIIGYSDAGNQYLITKVVVADAKRDVAILEFFSPTDLSPLLLAEKAEERRAEPVVTVGSPLGLKNSVSLGNISAVFEDDGVSYIQFTAPISKGSSGGALLNDSGQVIGITSASLIEGQNINLAVDIDEVIRLYKDSLGKARMKLSNYESSLSTPSVTIAPTNSAVEMPASKPTSSPDTLLANIYFLSGMYFDSSVLKSYDGYDFDKFEKTWVYDGLIDLDKNMALGGSIRGSNIAFATELPVIVIFSLVETHARAYVKLVDFLVGEKIFTFSGPRYYEEVEGVNVIYLGMTGKKMIEETAKATTISIRLTFYDNSIAKYDLKPQTFSVYKAWCKNLTKYKIFDLFQSSSLKKADSTHDAYVH